MQTTNQQQRNGYKVTPYERAYTAIFNAYEQTANWVTRSLSRFRQKMEADPRRNYSEEYGYLDSYDETLYYLLYEYEGVARRVIDIMPKETWAVPPRIRESDDPATPTAFDEAFPKLGESLKGDSWYKSEEGEGNPFWEVCRTADELAGIGHYGVILLGLDDGKDLREPAAGIDPVTGRFKDYEELPEVDEAGALTGNLVKTPLPSTDSEGKPARKLLFMRAFPERYAKITRVEDSTSSPRLGLPTEYRIALQKPDSAPADGVGFGAADVYVHWTRVIHIPSDEAGHNPVFHPPRLMSVLRYVYNIIKVGGGSAEMYYRAAMPGMSIESQQGINPADFEDPAILQEMKDQAYQMQQGMDRIMTLLGMTSKVHAPAVADPTPQISIQIDFICITKGIPNRKFKGSERGELASSQDDGDWTDRVRGRQEDYNTPSILVPVVDRLIALRCLPMPQKYGVEWPDPDALKPAEKADILVKRTTALGTYVEKGLNTAMAEEDFYTREMGFTEDEAAQIIERAAEREEELVEKNVEMDAEGLNPDGTPKQPPEDRVLKPGDNLVDKDGKVKTAIPAPPAGKAAPPK